MHRYAEGTFGNVEKTKRILHQDQYFSCIAMPTEPSEC